MINKDEFRKRARKSILNRIYDHISEDYYEHVGMILDCFPMPETVKNKEVEELERLYLTIASEIAEEIKNKIK